MARFLALALLASTALLIACGSDTDSGPPSNQRAVERTGVEEPTPTSEESSRCEDAALIAAEGISFGLTVSGGGSLRDAMAVKSNDYVNAFFIAAEIDGPGLEGEGDIGVWVSNSLEPGGGVIYAVDGMANEFTDWGDGRRIDAAFSASDDGAQEAKKCVEDSN